MTSERDESKMSVLKEFYSVVQNAVHDNLGLSFLGLIHLNKKRRKF